MKVIDLIKNTDYPLIQYRVTHPDIPEGVFFGACKSVNGSLISLDGDNYSEDDEIISYETFINPNTNETCLEVLIEGEWI